MGLRPTHPPLGALLTGPDAFGLNPPMPISYRASLVSDSESGSLKFKILLNEYTTKKMDFVFANVSELCVSFGIKYNLSTFGGDGGSACRSLGHCQLLFKL